jgi:hypothetical protein
MKYWEENIFECGGKGMDVNGALLVCYWQGKNETLGEKYYRVYMVDIWTSVVQWWDNTDRGKLN